MQFFKTILLLALLLAAIAAFYLYVPYGPTSETFVEIHPGTGTETIAAQLEAAGVLRSRYAFDLMRLIKGDVTLKAGEYRFDHPAPVSEVYARIVRGDSFTLTLKVPEGYNLFDIAQAAESAGLGPKAGFLAAAREHVQLIAPLLPAGAPLPASLEGYLFPETYHFTRHATPLQILTAMVRRFRQALVQLDATGDRPADLPRTVIMASLIEKEVSQDSERPLVAGVFANRLERGMPLATDPTVVYAALLEDRWRGTIYASDLQSPSPYNTYRRAGLPPGPICNPGLAALRAALHPTPTDYLYFVADANGHSRFSTTLKEHADRVREYREATRPAGPAQK